MDVRSLLNGRVVIALMMLVIFLGMSLVALGFPPKARLMPLLAGIPGSILAFVQLLIEVRTRNADHVPDASAGAAERHMFIWIFLFFAGILCFGFIYTAPLLVFAFMRFGSRESTPVSVVSAAATWLVLWGIFEQGFAIPLFEGLVVEAFYAA